MDPAAAMSTRLPSDVVLLQLEAFGNRVALLTEELRQAQDKITRLEAATYTSPASPAKHHQDSTSPISHQDPSKAPALTLQHRTQEDRSCACEKPCELQRHLQPIQDSIATLTAHLLRGDASRGAANKSDQSTQTTELPPTGTNSTGEDAVSSKLTESPPSQFTPYQENAHKSRKERSQRERSSDEHRPIFGQPSTPATRTLSLSTCSTGSSFSNYADDRSPFVQLASRLPDGRMGMCSRDYNWGKKVQMKPLGKH